MAMVEVGRLSASDLPSTVAVLERSLFGLGGCVEGEGMGGVRRPHSAVRSCYCSPGCCACQVWWASAVVRYEIEYDSVKDACDVILNTRPF